MAMQLQRTVLKGRQSLLQATNKLRLITQCSSISGNYTGSKGPKTSNGKDTLGATNTKEVHMSTLRQYPRAEPLPLPLNVEDIDAAEKARFSPQRSRDISGPVILSKTVGTFGNGFANRYNHVSSPSDPHVASYDCTGAVSLSSCMQTNVPDPFSSKGKSTNLNMPGGQWGQGYKYIAEDMQNSHYRNIIQRRSGNGEQQGSDRSAV